MTAFIYNSRNYSILLNVKSLKFIFQSTTVEIILYYLTLMFHSFTAYIYNSRNYSILLNALKLIVSFHIYNSRNYSILLNRIQCFVGIAVSTTVEIILYYLTPNLCICTIFLEPSNFIFIILYNICTKYVK